MSGWKDEEEGLGEIVQEGKQHNVVGIFFLQ